MTAGDIRALVAEMLLADLRELEIDGPAFRCRIVAAAPRHPRASPALAPSTPRPPAPTPTLRSPGVGLLRLGHPSWPDLRVGPGTVVREGRLVAFLQVRALYLPVTATASGKIVRILAADGDPVEYDAPLFELAPSQTPEETHG